MVLFQDAGHGVMYGAGYGAVNGGGVGLVGLSTGVGQDTTGRNGTVAQGPQELFIPFFLLGFVGFHVRQGARHPLEGMIDGCIHRVAFAVLQAVFGPPDVQRCLLQRNFLFSLLLYWLIRYSAHCHLLMISRTK